MLDTSSKTHFRLIHSGTLSAKENMAIDKVLFENFTKDLVPILRVYTWENSFTYGMSSSISKLQNKKELQKYKSNYAKRMTGGGILFHGNDISYSLIIPTSFMQSLNVKKSYEEICSFLLNFYSTLGLEALYAKDNISVEQSKNDFCQLGFEEYDILVGDKKIGGNAQRRTKNVILQHGSIGISKLDETLHSGNCLEDFEVFISEQDALKKLVQSFERTFNVILQDSILNDKENKQVQEMLQKEES